jgi:uncharacterized protein YhaN
MRIDRLNLLAYGPFTDHPIDLAGSGVQIVYGENGAGKTTAMRALHGLLFGIPTRSTDDWIHEKGSMRVGGHLRGDDGETLECLRRKGNKNTLLDADEEPLDPNRLRAILGGLTEDLFTSMYCLDHTRLRAGSEELLRGGGLIGEALFGAGAGAGVRDVLRDLERQAGELFRPRGQNQKVNAGLSAFHVAIREQRDLGATVTQWKSLRDALEQTRGEVEELDEKARTLRERHSAADRLRRVLGALTERALILKELESVSDVPELDKSAVERRLEAARRKKQAQLALTKANEVIERRREDIEKLDPPRSMIERASEISALFQRVGEIRKALVDLPALERQHREHRADAGRALREIDPSLALEAAEQRRVGTEDRANIEKLGSAHAVLETKLEDVRLQHDETRKELAEKQADLKELSEPLDVTKLSQLVASISEDGDLERQLAEEKDKLETLQAAAARLMGRLEQAGEDPQRAAALAVPMKATVESFRERDGDLTRRSEALRDKLNEAATEHQETQGRLEELERAEEIPTQNDLLQARARRDSGWQAVRAAWLDDDEEPGREFDETKALPDAFEESQRRSDEVADRLRADAERVATKAQLEEKLGKLIREQEQLAEQEAELAIARTEHEEAWSRQWAAIGIEPRTPVEMLEWIDRHDELRGAVGECGELATAVTRLEGLIAKHRTSLSAAFAEIGEPGLADVETLRTARVRAEALKTTAIESKQNREGLTRLTTGLSERLRRQESAVLEAQKKLEEWAKDWKSVVEKLELQEGSTVAAATAVLQKFDSVFERLRDAEKLESRIEGLKRDIGKFEADTDALLSELDPDLATSDKVAAVERLDERAQQAKKELATVDATMKQIAEEEEKAAEAEAEEESAAEELEALMKAAGVDDLASLEAVERADASRRELRRRLTSIEETITTTGVDSAEDLAARAASADADALPAEIAMLEEELKDIERERDEANRRRGEAESELRGVAGADAAAQAAERAQRELAKVRSNAERYVRVKLAIALLKQAMEDYREQSQGPVLGRARELFPQLTAGAFEDLVTDFNDSDEPVIRPVREGERIEVGSLSDGERDSLYLALRVATFEHMFSMGTPMPIVLDDLFLNFDDRRASLGFEALRQLAKQTQVVFFTHHDHLVRLAESAIPMEDLAIHRLPSPLGVSAPSQLNGQLAQVSQ